MELESISVYPWWGLVTVTPESSGSLSRIVLPSAPLWQTLTVSLAIIWLHVAKRSKPSMYARRLLQPICKRLALKGVSTIFYIQKFRRPWLDAVMACMAAVVSIPFYTAFLPILFWSGQPMLARHLSFLMALCIYVAAVIKDVVCSPRPASPPVWRNEVIDESGREFGLPSSHTINFVALSLYLMRHFLQEGVFDSRPGFFWAATLFLSLVAVCVISGRLYLGMHSLLDICAGFCIGLLLPFLWELASPAVDHFLLNGQNVLGFFFVVLTMLQFAYPVPETPTPSFDDCTAFNGVVFGVIAGVHRTFLLNHSVTEWICFSTLTSAGVAKWVLRMLIGFPMILIAKSLGKKAGILLLPILGKWAGLPFKSSVYVKCLTGPGGLQEGQENPEGVLAATSCEEVRKGQKESEAPPRGSLVAMDGALEACKVPREASRLKRLSWGSPEEALDIDVGIRFMAYAALAWAVTELCPLVFNSLGI